MTNGMIRKIEFFKKKGIKVHITLKDSSWINGYFIRENDYAELGVYSFKDDEYGQIPLFVEDIFKIDKFREGNKNGRS